MAVTDIILQEPSYGWANEKGELIVPGTRRLFSEAAARLNIFRSKKNWISFFSLWLIACLLVCLYFFISRYFSLTLLVVLLLYSLFIMSIHTTVWLHRYCTHRAFRFSHPVWRFVFQNLVIKTVPEEVYTISHHVHHIKSDKPGDPYNARGGFLYCMLAEFNHQRIAPNMGEADYQIAVRLLRHTGVRINSYAAYRKWGTITSPVYIILLWLFNWSCWYGIFYWIGGHGLSLALFSGTLFWFIMVRAFNYTGHGKGHEVHKDGIDFDRRNLSVNQVRPGILAGEWHNNHHLYPASARTGFLNYQIDLPWLVIYGMYKLGMVSTYHDSKKEFLKKYMQPFTASQKIS